MGSPLTEWMGIIASTSLKPITFNTTDGSDGYYELCPHQDCEKSDQNMHLELNVTPYIGQSNFMEKHDSRKKS